MNSVERLRKKSGEINSKNNLACFLYLLMRDEIVPGKVEELVLKIEDNNGEMVEYTNGWLAKYAINLAKRVKGE